MASSCHSRVARELIRLKVTDVYIPVPALAATCLVRQHHQHPHIFLIDHSSPGEC